jgi:hypothetical protein
VAALDEAWSAIQVRHPEVPAVVIVVGSGSPAKAGDGLRLGHFAALRWQHGSDRMPEVLVSGEGLSRSPAEVLTTLLHEAAHALAYVRGISDTSRQGRWHNKHFAQLAAEVGLLVAKDDKLGWSTSTLVESTQDRYAAVMEQLGAAMVAYRHPDEQAEGKRSSNNNGVTLTCACPRKIRVSLAVAAEGPITCGVCEAQFLTDEQRENGEEDQAVRHAYDPTGEHHGGMPTYPYKFAPDGLATVRQLRAKGLRPGGQEIAAQILWRKGKRVAYLYRLDLAVPKRTATAAQLVAVEKALLARRRCPTCERVKDYYIPRRHGECLDCAGVISPADKWANDQTVGVAA